MTLQLVSRYRGVQLGDKTPDNLTSVLAHGANVIRYQLVTGWDNSVLKSPDTYRTWLDSQLELLDQTLDAQPANVFGVLDLHTPPGGMTGSVYSIFSDELPDEWCKKCFYETWGYLATRYKTSNKIKVYGILNEPSCDSNIEVHNLMQIAANLIRKIDKQKYIAITGRYSAPDTIRSMANIDDPKPWFEFHMYDPLPFTHQGLAGFPTNQVYPSPKYTKAAVYARLKVVRDFQIKYDIKTIFVGEFSCDGYADLDSRYQYLNDLVKKFEEYGWNYCYHAWREANTWNMETNPKILKMFIDKWGAN